MNGGSVQHAPGRCIRDPRTQRRCLGDDRRLCFRCANEQGNVLEAVLNETTRFTGFCFTERTEAPLSADRDKYQVVTMHGRPALIPVRSEAWGD